MLSSETERGRGRPGKVSRGSLILTGFEDLTFPSRTGTLVKF